MKTNKTKKATITPAYNAANISMLEAFLESQTELNRAQKDIALARLKEQRDGFREKSKPWYRKIFRGSTLTAWMSLGISMLTFFGVSSKKNHAVVKPKIVIVREIVSKSEQKEQSKAYSLDDPPDLDTFLMALEHDLAASPDPESRNSWSTILNELKKSKQITPQQKGKIDDIDAKYLQPIQYH